MNSIKTSAVIFRKDLYPRLKPDPAKIQTYAADSDQLPPIEINQDNILIDGYHRLKAHETNKADKIACIITQTESDAHISLLAVQRNAKHGLQLSQDDKKRCALQWWDIRPQDEICNALSISPRTFSRWTKHKRLEKAKQEKQHVNALWLSCHTQAEIADIVGISQPAIAEIVQNITAGQMAESDILDNPQIYTVWNFSKLTNETTIFGSIPQEILDNLLYYYTEPFDVIFDPFAGGGMTIDVCTKRKRRYYVSDLTPLIARENEIRQWDITDGLPPNLPVPDLVFLDPPYWKQAQGKYSEKDTDIANVSLEIFLDTIGNIARDIKHKWKDRRPQARLALIVGLYKNEGQYVDLPFLCYERIAKYLKLAARIQVPYSTQVHGGKFVELAKKNKELLYLSRDLMVFRQ